ncbi:unnamed protein product [Camellia sinensis]
MVDKRRLLAETEIKASMATDVGWLAAAFISASSSLAGTFSCLSIDTTVWGDRIYLLVHETPVPFRAPPKHPVVLNIRTGISALEFVVCHVCKLVQHQLVRLILLVGVVNMVNIILEHTELVVLRIKAPRHCVMAPPLLMERKAKKRVEIERKAIGRVTFMSII